jgi:hypothetical protein
VVCPLGFWGLSRVIERHAHDPARAAVAQRDFALQAEPVRWRKELNPLRVVLLGANGRVDKALPRRRAGMPPAGVAAVRAAVAETVGGPPVEAGDWAAWAAAVQAHGPTLEVLLVHTDFGDTGDSLQRLELGDKDYLELVYLEPEHVRHPQRHPEPIVLLIGCETGAPQVAFHNFVARFREKGAAIVVSTGSTVLGRHAAPVAVEFVRALGQVRTSDASFGDVMVEVRRTLLARGLPAVLCLSAYGDADWRLAGAAAAEAGGGPRQAAGRNRRRAGAARRPHVHRRDAARGPGGLPLGRVRDGR